MNLFRFCVLSSILIFGLVLCEDDVKFASPCEVCKIVSNELEARLKETGRSHEVIETGYNIDAKKKTRTKYKASELRLVESLEGLCQRMLEYRLHKEKTDSSRFAKEMSQTFKTLHGLVAKGVKVDLGIPLEMWDNPPAEITQLRTQCETLLEDYEETIEDWYSSQQDSEQLQNYLCRKHVLSKKDQACLNEKGEKGVKMRGEL